MSRILLVEDEPGLVSALSEYLRREGFEPLVATTCAQARALLTHDVSLAVLDWMLPDGHGVDLVREWRAQNKQTPIIMLTARTELIDRVLGLEMGANDYLTKPFEPRELLARIRVQFRRAPSPSRAALGPDVLRYAGIEMDLLRHVAMFSGKPVELTKMEFALLKLLLENPERVFTRDELLNKVWGFDNYPTTRTVDTHVLQLRHKFSAHLFMTVRGIGYRLIASQS
jgi:DNA-binding response OmpR family regulator